MSNADIFISIHCDVSSNSSIRGVHAYHPNNHDVVLSERLGNAAIHGVYSYSSIPKFVDARYGNNPWGYNPWKYNCLKIIQFMV